MALTFGTRLGPYEIVAPLGAGGMGEVYRARDAKLNRDVALKVLPESVAGDPDRLARFRREAQVLAALNHPNIAHIHGFEDSGTIHALVMELVEGPTLAERIAQGPIPLAEALPIARQIADALESAHEQGIVHRDLKPANVKVREDGTVKVLDFGLAKAMDQTSASDVDVMNSPTLSNHATQGGIILGTAAYMSPEQAAGKPVDKRTDLWAFGVVLFEMLTGRQVFDGETVSHVIAAVLTRDPDWTALPAGTPLRLRSLLARCLDRDRKTRLRDIGEARIEIARIEAGPSADLLPTHGGAVSGRPSVWLYSGVAAVVGAASVGTAWWVKPAPLTPGALSRFAHVLPDGQALTRTGRHVLALSPDGTTLAYIANQQIYLRPLDQLDARPLQGTDEDPMDLVFSPDSQWIAYSVPATKAGQTGGSLKKIAVTGGAPLKLCPMDPPFGITWRDGTILFGQNIGGKARILAVADTGGTARTLLSLEGGTVAQPQLLDHGRQVLYSQRPAPSGTSWEDGEIVVQPLDGGPRKVIVRGGYDGRLLPTGHLVYVHDGTIFTIGFDTARLKTTGDPVPVQEKVLTSPGFGNNPGSGQFTVSATGVLAYVPVGAKAARPGNGMDWMTRDGKTSVLRATPAVWINPRLSPDGHKVALQISDGKQTDIWVYEWARDTLTQLTFDAGQDTTPAWTPDGRRIVFASDRAKPGVSNLYWTNADGTGAVSRLTDSSEGQTYPSWHPGGKFLVFNANRGDTKADVMILAVDGNAVPGWTPGAPTVVVGTTANESAPVFSPDGRWIAYTSDEAGNHYVYVRPFPGPGGPWRVTTESAVLPHWSPSTRELLFLDFESAKDFQMTLMVAPYTVVGESFRAEKARPWSPVRIQGYNFDVHPDGKRVTVLAPAPPAPHLVQEKVVLVSNFFDHLRAIAPGRK